MLQLIGNTFCRLINWPVRRTLVRQCRAFCTLARADVLSDQFCRLRRLLIHAQLHVPYYRKLFNQASFDASTIRALSELRILSVLTKDRTRAAGEDMLAENFPRERLMHKSTGGSTGEPLVFFRHREYLKASRMGTYRNMMLCGWKPGDPVANFWGVNDPASFHRRARKEQLTMGFYTFNAFDAGPQVFGGWLQRLAQIRPVTLYGYASTIWLFCQWMKGVQSQNKRNVQKDWAKCLKGVFLTAERLHGFQRALIEEVLGVPVFNLYGSTEIQNIAFECTRGNMHVATDSVVVEVDAPQGDLGDFILTSLRNYAMPFIRYRNGDRGRLLGYVCDCGIQTPCISLEISRTCDNFQTRSGRVIHGEFFTHMMEGVGGIEKFQFRQVSLDRVDLQVVASPTLQDSDRARVVSIPDAISVKTNHELKVELLWVADIVPTHRGKHLFTISEIAEGSSRLDLS